MSQQNKNTIHQASYSQVFLKNFIAGAARGLGGLFIWFIVVFVGYKLLWPQLTDQIQRLINLINTLQENPIVQINQQVPQTLNQLFDAYVPK